MSDVKRPTARPLSPHLQVYAWRPHMVVSTLHRITSVALSGGTLLLAWGLIALATGPGAYAIFASVLSSIAGKLVLLGFTWALCQHLMSGLRHLVMDTGAALDKHTSRTLSYATFVGSFGLTAVIWAVALFV
ncbi:MAG: succinate dehydrogenase, cytochrome b556 subunit [Pseudomonadota bacterium]